MPKHTNPIEPYIQSAQDAVASLLHVAVTFPAAVPAVLPVCRRVLEKSWSAFFSHAQWRVVLHGRGAVDLIGYQLSYVQRGLLPPVALEQHATQAYIYREIVNTFQGVLPGDVTVRLRRQPGVLEVSLSTGQRAVVTLDQGDVAGVVAALGRDTCAVLLPYMYNIMPDTPRPLAREPVWSKLGAAVSYVGAAQRALVLALVGTPPPHQARAALVAAAARAPAGLPVFCSTLAWAREPLYTWCAEGLSPAVKWLLYVAGRPPPPGFALEPAMQALVGRKVVARGAFGANRAAVTASLQGPAPRVVGLVRAVAWSPARAAWAANGPS